MAEKTADKSTEPERPTATHAALVFILRHVKVQNPELAREAQQHIDAVDKQFLTQRPGKAGPKGEPGPKGDKGDKGEPGTEDKLE